MNDAFSSSLLLVDEEEEDNKTSKNASSSSSLLLERKREKMLDRLRETERLRKQKRDASRREHEAKTRTRRKTWRRSRRRSKKWWRTSNEILLVLDDASKGQKKKTNDDKLENALTKIAVLRERVAKSAYFLPKFDAEKSMKTCDALEKKAREGGAKAEASGKKTKKFSFAAKMVKKKTGDEKDSRSSASASSSATVIEMLQKKHREINSLVVCENRDGEKIHLTSEECDGKDVTIERLTRCKVTIESLQNRKPRSVRMRNLVECEIKATDIDGSAYVEGMRDTIAFIGSRQLRIHDATKCQFYCRVASGPIIEKCEGVEFAPLSPREEDNLWDKVEDFGWIKQEKSPNWSVIEEKDRKYSKNR